MVLFAIILVSTFIVSVWICIGMGVSRGVCSFFPKKEADVANILVREDDTVSPVEISESVPIAPMEGITLGLVVHGSDYAPHPEFAAALALCAKQLGAHVVDLYTDESIRTLESMCQYIGTQHFHAVLFLRVEYRPLTGDLRADFFARSEKQRKQIPIAALTKVILSVDGSVLVPPYYYHLFAKPIIKPIPTVERSVDVLREIAMRICTEFPIHGCDQTVERSEIENEILSLALKRPIAVKK